MVGGVTGLVLRFIEVRSKTITFELPLPTKRTLPSGVVVLPSGPDIGFTPLAREAQHWAPGNPPRLPLGPKPVFRWNLEPLAQVTSVLQAYLNEIAKHVSRRRNHLHVGNGRSGHAGLGNCGAWAGAITSIGDTILSLNRENREVLRRVDHLHGNADAVGNVIQIRPSRPRRVRGDRADVERVERAAGLAGRIVLGHGNDVDDGVGAIDRGAASGAIRRRAAAAQDHKQRGEKNQ